MTFAHPLILILLAVPILLAAWEWQRAGHLLRLPFDHAQARSTRLQWIVRALQLSAPALLAVAILLLAGPKRLRLSDDARVLNNVVFCIDMSGSMMASFGDSTRSAKALSALTDFTKYRKGDAFGLTAFGTEVLHWVPVTKDLRAIASAAPFLNPARMPSYMGGTRIGNAVREVQKVLTAQPEGDRLIVLISDGESYDLSSGVAQQLGQELRANHIQLFYIHVAEGSPQEETFTLASLSGGEAFTASDPRALQEVFRRIDTMKPAKLKPVAPVPVDFFWPFTVAAVVCLAGQIGVVLGLRFNPW